MEYSASVHQNGNKKGAKGSKGASQEHNERTLEYSKSRQQAISENIETIVSLDLKQTYDEIFGESTARYNERQKDERRKITSHYDNILNNKQKHLYYEMIFSIGTMDDRGTNEYENFVKPRFSKVCKELVQKLNTEFPNNLKVFSANIHYDEKGAYHMHLDYIPVAHGYKNGQDIQANADRAFQECGFANKDKDDMPITPQQAFCEYCQKTYDDLLKKEKIQVKEHGHGRGVNLNIETYKKVKDEVKAELKKEHKLFSKNPTKFAEVLKEKQKYETDLIERMEKTSDINQMTLKADIDNRITAEKIQARNADFEKTIIAPRLKELEQQKAEELTREKERIYTELHGNELAEKKRINKEIDERMERAKKITELYESVNKTNEQLSATNRQLIQDNTALEMKKKRLKEENEKLEKEKAEKKEQADRELAEYKAKAKAQYDKDYPTFEGLLWQVKQLTRTVNHLIDWIKDWKLFGHLKSRAERNNDTGGLMFAMVDEKEKEYEKEEEHDIGFYR